MVFAPLILFNRKYFRNGFVCEGHNHLSSIVLDDLESELNCFVA